ncbi:copper chaperone [Mycoblastus sanguinarius]|nr:copper chaperone [Mycoblastus sanguinarius]
MTCDACIKDISGALSDLPDIQETSFSLPTQLLTTTGTTPPSTIISTIQSTGRPAILRGSGSANSAAVCILETPPPSPPSVPEPSPVRGLARLIQLSDRLTMLDMTLTGLPKGTYSASMRQTGDISAGAASMGGIFIGPDGNRNGELGRLEVDERGRGALVGEVDWRVWEMVGRGILVENAGEDKEREGVVIGVVARSAGVWENEKVICGCSGKTVWEEREEMVGRGML